jgi:hypothetical protein
LTVFDHDVLIEILRKNIHDDRFLKLLKGMLKAGYMEDWKYHKTYSGTPQGGIISPLLANIVLNELDCYVEEVLIPEYTKGTVRRMNPEYKKLANIKEKAKKQKEKWVWEDAAKRMRQLAARMPDDPNYKRVRYLRYADDSILGVIGTRQDAEDIKGRIGDFLSGKKLEMSEEKTMITHARTERARFLNYEIFTDWNNTKLTVNSRGVKTRSVNGDIVLAIPRDVYVRWKKKANGKRKKRQARGNVQRIGHRPELINLGDYDIISTYETELQGLINYYALAHNVYKRMTTLRYFWFMSLANTLAAKFKTKKTSIYKKYLGYTADGRKVLMKKVEREGKEPLVAVFGRKPIERKMNVVIKDTIAHIHIERNEIVTRLLANTCELCGHEGEVEGHHIRKLKDLKKRWAGRKEKPEWVKRMIALHRKTLFVCDECHQKIHNGTYDGKKL